MTTSWVSVCRAGNSHGLHNHVGAKWSGVYYASVPEEPADSAPKSMPNAGNGAAKGARSPSRVSPARSPDLSGHLILRLCSGGGTPGDAGAAEGWCMWQAVPPREGRLVLFPSWMLHGVLAVRPARVTVAVRGEKHAPEREEEQGRGREPELGREPERGRDQVQRGEQDQDLERDLGGSGAGEGDGAAVKPRVSIAFNTGEQNVVLDTLKEQPPQPEKKSKR